jgi:hypothetical protein
MLIIICVKCRKPVRIKLSKPFWKIRLWGITGGICKNCLCKKYEDLKTRLELFRSKEGLTQPKKGG